MSARALFSAQLVAHVNSEAQLPDAGDCLHFTAAQRPIDFRKIDSEWSGQRCQ